jgi:hypothetical protein
VKRWLGSHDGTSFGQPIVTVSLAAANAASNGADAPMVAALPMSICKTVLRGRLNAMVCSLNSPGTVPVAERRRRDDVDTIPATGGPGYRLSR